jgi:erythromycin esterase-like protein
MSTAIQRDAAVVAREARRISTAADCDRLIERASQAQLILIGEASHGTQDLCQTRAALTQRLIYEHGFRAVVCEADRPDSFRVHVDVTGRSDDLDAIAALSDFRDSRRGCGEIPLPPSSSSG